uniref:Uncharacterized protein n=2 Tax=Chromera velia CCMP2878 TaxID=1169474 RepID=A0A0G4IFT9_9ALVE|mmetsp:Transcript_55358/g.108367  ORF Transcript_55358/g.108367 Transcript_55358/m.108367 type:complete len:226 (-) Transcript_55358:150-827(-)|eukprot:Cvel_14144.t1-p1 / transcript=Cvel_14144.t1 / gene=Cvel_14144 / organism=Chromera_velia_CCMP2878 / gene_product=hypothetical protein / transcript_product=hypothetical protein / location=Cvel_scaffold996:57375-59048(+) / protein_length=225 / sequence_SO=supercontig / SO=protein_coding / is_pseudo=false
MQTQPEQKKSGKAKGPAGSQKQPGAAGAEGFDLKGTLESLGGLLGGGGKSMGEEEKEKLRKMLTAVGNIVERGMGPKREAPDGKGYAQRDLGGSISIHEEMSEKEFEADEQRRQRERETDSRGKKDEPAASRDPPAAATEAPLPSLKDLQSVLDRLEAAEEEFYAQGGEDGLQTDAALRAWRKTRNPREAVRVGLSAAKGPSPGEEENPWETAYPREGGLMQPPN